MSYFTALNDLNTTGEFDAAPTIEPIPEGTQVIALATEAGWEEYQGENFIKVTWEVVQGEHKGRKVFHKLKLEEPDSSKREKAIRMFAAIDSNFGGHIVKLDMKPTTEDMGIYWLNKPIALKLGVWDIDGKTGNWVQAVAPVNKPQPQAEPQSGVIPDDIPF